VKYGKEVSKLGGEMGLRKEREILIRRLYRRLKSGESMLIKKSNVYTERKKRQVKSRE